MVKREFEFNSRGGFSWGPHLIASTASDELITTLSEKGKEVRNPKFDWSNALAGRIKEEYKFQDYQEWFPPLFHQHLVDYFDSLPEGKSKQTMKSWKNGFEWQIESLWINYQGPKEYNPPHTHGGDLSFVVYVDIPQEILDENEVYQKETGKIGPGIIVFDSGDSVYGNFLSFFNNTINFTPKTGMILIFPAYLTHHVYAFDSDVKRVSVSGNIIIREK